MVYVYAASLSSAMTLHGSATVIDINYGANADIMENCKVLSEYAQFIAKIREECGRLEKAKSNNQDILRQAIDAATEYCIQNLSLIHI